jgi:CHAD domain-containing protein
MTQADPRQTRSAVSDTMTAEEAVHTILSVCLADFDSHRAALMAGDAADGPHGARVALRRFRTALDGLQPLLRKSRVKPLKEEAKAIFALLGRLRDADVLAGQLAKGDEAARLAAEADRIRAEVRADLDGREAEGFAAGALLLLDSGEWKRRGKAAKATRRAPMRDVAAEALDRAWAAVGGHGKHVHKMPVAERHGFRKDLKALRYLTDFFSDLWPGKAQVRFLARLKRLQDALGVLNDLAVAEGRLGDSGAKVRAALRDEAMTAAQTEWRALRKTGPWWG